MSAQLGDPNIVTTWNPAIVRGFGVRPNDTEILIGLQQGADPRASAWTCSGRATGTATSS